MFVSWWIRGMKVLVKQKCCLWQNMLYSNWTHLWVTVTIYINQQTQNRIDGLTWLHTVYWILNLNFHNNFVIHSWFCSYFINYTQIHAHHTKPSVVIILNHDTNRHDIFNLHQIFKSFLNFERINYSTIPILNL